MSKLDGSQKYRLSWITLSNKRKKRAFSVQFMVIETNNEEEVITWVNRINNRIDTYLPVSIERIVPLKIFNKSLVLSDDSLSVSYKIAGRISFDSKEIIQEVLNEKQDSTQNVLEDKI